MQRKSEVMADIDDAALGELGRWIDEGLLPELVPTHQGRSLRNALAMLDAGRELLHDGGLEELSVEAVCQLAGTTVGAFYGRFENKQAFFLTLQRVQTMRSQHLLSEFSLRHSGGGSTLDVLVREMVELTVRNFRVNAGVLRASLQHTQEGMWKVMKASGDRHRKAFVDAIAPLLDLPRETARMRVLFAYQALAGVLVHATLNNPGPLGLEDDALATELARLLNAYVRA
jgi:AcrR family transcriptional regulator